MVETATKLPIKNEAKAPSASSGAGWQPFEDLRREVNRLFEDFGRGAWLGPLRSTSIEPLFRNIGWNAPAVDVAEHLRDGNAHVGQEYFARRRALHAHLL